MINIKAELESRIARNQKIVDWIEQMDVGLSSCVSEFQAEIMSCKVLISRFGGKFATMEKRLVAFMKQAYGVSENRMFHVDAVYDDCINVSDEKHEIGAICHLNAGLSPIACSAGMLDGSDSILPATLIGNTVILPNNNRVSLAF